MSAATAAAATGRTRLAARPGAYYVGLVRGQHVDIIAIYRRHRYFRAFQATRSSPTATWLFLLNNSSSGKRNATRELTLMTSDDRASLWEPRNRNGRMLVGSTLDEQDDDSDVTDDDDGVFTEAWPRHSHDTDDDNDDDVLTGTGGMALQHGTRTSRDGVWPSPCPWLTDASSFHSEDSAVDTIHRLFCDSDWADTKQ